MRDTHVFERGVAVFFFLFRLLSIYLLFSIVIIVIIIVSSTLKINACPPSTIHRRRSRTRIKYGCPNTAIFHDFDVLRFTHLRAERHVISGFYFHIKKKCRANQTTLSEPHIKQQTKSTTTRRRRKKKSIARLAYKALRPIQPWQSLATERQYMKVGRMERTKSTMTTLPRL